MNILGLISQLIGIKTLRLTIVILSRLCSKKQKKKTKKINCNSFSTKENIQFFVLLLVESRLFQIQAQLRENKKIKLALYKIS